MACLKPEDSWSTPPTQVPFYDYDSQVNGGIMENKPATHV